MSGAQVFAGCESSVPTRARRRRDTGSLRREAVAHASGGGWTSDPDGDGIVKLPRLVLSSCSGFKLST